jgi:isoleucyl-tRNA synthetase
VVVVIPLTLRRKVVCIGSIEELNRLSGCGHLTDLHRDKIDHITIPSQKGKGVLRRVEEVFDCWFESGRSVATFCPMTTCIFGSDEGRRLL